MRTPIFFLLTTLFFVGLVAPSTAQAQAGATQFVFVVDDSSGGSADPDRLALFATRSMLTMLDADDQITVSGINTASSALSPLAPLRENERSLLALLSLDGELAAYNGPRTPCSDALSAVKQELESAYRPGTPQVVVFMSRHRCTGTAINADRFLTGLGSHDEELLQFHFLKWPGQTGDRGLVELTRKTGGIFAEVHPSDPTRLIEPFAQILSRSRGSNAYVLRPGRDVLPAHSRARRIHLLAIAPDTEETLTISPASLVGDTRLSTEISDSGRHQFNDGIPFRFASLRYEPNNNPVRLSVSGAGSLRRVEITRRAIVINEAIHFDVDRDTIRAQSHDLLDEIAAVMRAAPRIKQVEIQGHTDHAGSAEYNLDLSRRRAESVRRYLIEKGVAPTRLSARGYGFSEPVVPLSPGGRESAEAAAQNRRVDFVITDQDAADDSELGDGDWVVIAVPDYRLSVRTTVTAGDCGASDSPVSFVPVGADACVRIDLVNDQGQLVTFDLAGENTRATVKHQFPSGADRQVSTTRPGAEPRFLAPLTRLVEGDHVFLPQITLTGRNQPDLVLRGQPFTLQASSRSVSADPGELELGDVRPGSEHYHSFVLHGNFPTTEARLQVRDRDDVPACVSFTLSGVEEKASQPLTSGQTYTIATQIAPNCLANSDSVSIDTALEIVFDNSPDAQPIPTLLIPVRAELQQTMELVNAPISVTLTAGQDKTVPLKLLSNHGQELPLQVLVAAPEERSSWPERLRHLDLDFFGPNEDSAVALPPSTEPGTIGLRLKSSPCCSAGTYRTPVALLPTTAGAAPLMTEVEVIVEAAGFWACWGPRILATLAIILLILLLIYLVNIFRSTHLLDKKRLAGALLPLEWDEMRQATPRTRASTDVSRMVFRELSFFNRLKNWLRSNPLVLGLPGREYVETVELSLQPSLQPGRSRIILIAENDHRGALRDAPQRALGRVFASARGGLSFYAVPNRDGRLGALTLHDEFASFGFDDDEFTPSIQNLRRRSELRAHSDTGSEPGTFAGWRVG